MKTKVSPKKSMCGLLCSNLNADCLSEPSCNFLFVVRVGLCCGFCDFAVSFWYRQTVPKMGPLKVLFFLLSCRCSPKKGTARRAHLWDCLSSFFEVFCIRVAEAQSFGFNETLWLVVTGRATREALLSEAGFEKVFPTQNWVRRSNLFVDDLFLVGASGVHISCCLNPLEVSFLLFRCVWWLDCLPEALR